MGVWGRRAPRSALTLGVEEEFLLLHPDTAATMPVVDSVMAALPQPARACARREFRACQLELASPIATDLTQLRRQLRYLRSTAAAASRVVGARLVAIAATPLPDPDPPLSGDPRYAAMARRFGAITAEPGVCGCHVHVGLPDRELAVQVSNHLRLYLPTIQALAANSPLYAGRDSGYASWRCVQFARWPSAGPTPYLKSAEDYDQTIRQLIASGVMLDQAMVYWYARPSATYPTIEVRVADVCPTVDETVLLAGLTRGLVAHFIGEVRRGALAPPVAQRLVVAAHWRAARDGLDGQLVDLRALRLRPAWQLVDELVAMIRPELIRYRDWRTVAKGLARLRRCGNGAQRQRRLYRDGGQIEAVAAYLAEQTEAG